MRQTKPQARQEHTPVWDVLWSSRSRICDLIFPGEYQEGRKKRTSQPATADETIAKEPQRTKQGDSVAYWAVQIGKDMVIVTLQLLHILLAGYDPKRKKPDIRWLSPDRIQTSRSQ